MGTKDLVHKILTKRIASKVAFDINDPQFKQFLTKLNLERVSAGKKPFVNFKRMKPEAMKTLWDASRLEKLPPAEPGRIAKTLETTGKVIKHVKDHKVPYAIGTGTTLATLAYINNRRSLRAESERAKQINRDKPWNTGHVALGAGIGLIALAPIITGYINKNKEINNTEG